MKKIALMLAAVTVLAMGSALAQTTPSHPGIGVFAPGEAIRQGAAFRGSVVTVRWVLIDTAPTNRQKAAVGVGAGVGALALLSVVHGDPAVRALSAIAGAFGGAAIAEEVTGKPPQREALEILVAMERSERVVSVVQMPDGEAFRAGMPVYVVNMQGNTRVVPAVMTPTAAR